MSKTTASRINPTAPKARKSRANVGVNGHENTVETPPESATTPLESTPAPSADPSPLPVEYFEFGHFHATGRPGPIKLLKSTVAPWAARGIDPDYSWHFGADLRPSDVARALEHSYSDGDDDSDFDEQILDGDRRVGLILNALRGNRFGGQAVAMVIEADEHGRETLQVVELTRRRGDDQDEE